MRKGRLVLAHNGHPFKGRDSPNRLLKTALWIVWLPIAAVLWLMVLDTSYDWISSPSTTRVIAGLLILLLMGLVVIALVFRGAKKLWTR
jgi:hypothetical protein